eukprot:g1745.t1
MELEEQLCFADEHKRHIEGLELISRKLRGKLREQQDPEYLLPRLKKFARHALDRWETLRIHQIEFLIPDPDGTDSDDRQRLRWWHRTTGPENQEGQFQGHLTLQPLPAQPLREPWAKKDEWEKKNTSVEQEDADYQTFLREERREKEIGAGGWVQFLNWMSEVVTDRYAAYPRGPSAPHHFHGLVQDVVESWVNKEGNSLSKEEIETYKGELKEFIRLSGGEKDRKKMPSSLRDNVVENLQKYGYDPELRRLEAELDGTALTGAARRAAPKWTSDDLPLFEAIAQQVQTEIGFLFEAKEKWLELFEHLDQRTITFSQLLEDGLVKEDFLRDELPLLYRSCTFYPGEEQFDPNRAEWYEKLGPGEQWPEVNEARQEIESFKRFAKTFGVEFKTENKWKSQRSTQLGAYRTLRVSACDRGARVAGFMLGCRCVSCRPMVVRVNLYIKVDRLDQYNNGDDWPTLNSVFRVKDKIKADKGPGGELQIVWKQRKGKDEPNIPVWRGWLSAELTTTLESKVAKKLGSGGELRYRKINGSSITSRHLQHHEMKTKKLGELIKEGSSDMQHRFVGSDQGRRHRYHKAPNPTELLVEYRYADKADARNVLQQYSDDGDEDGDERDLKDWMETHYHPPCSRERLDSIDRVPLLPDYPVKTAELPWTQFDTVPSLAQRLSREGSDKLRDEMSEHEQLHDGPLAPWLQKVLTLNRDDSSTAGTYFEGITAALTHLYDEKIRGDAAGYYEETALRKAKQLFTLQLEDFGPETLGQLRQEHLQKLRSAIREQRKRREEIRDFVAAAGCLDGDCKIRVSLQCGVLNHILKRREFFHQKEKDEDGTVTGEAGALYYPRSIFNIAVWRDFNELADFVGLLADADIWNAYLRWYDQAKRFCISRGESQGTDSSTEDLGTELSGEGYDENAYLAMRAVLDGRILSQLTVTASTIDLTTIEAVMELIEESHKGDWPRLLEQVERAHGIRWRLKAALTPYHTDEPEEEWQGNGWANNEAEDGNISAEILKQPNRANRLQWKLDAKQKAARQLRTTAKVAQRAKMRAEEREVFETRRTQAETDEDLSVPLHTYKWDLLEIVSSRCITGKLCALDVTKVGDNEGNVRSMIDKNKSEGWYADRPQAIKNLEHAGTQAQGVRGAYINAVSTEADANSRDRSVRRLEEVIGEYQTLLDSLDEVPAWFRSKLLKESALVMADTHLRMLLESIPLVSKDFQGYVQWVKDQVETVWHDGYKGKLEKSIDELDKEFKDDALALKEMAETLHNMRHTMEAKGVRHFGTKAWKEDVTTAITKECEQVRKVYEGVREKLGDEALAKKLEAEIELVAEECFNQGVNRSKIQLLHVEASSENYTEAKEEKTVEKDGKTEKKQMLTMLSMQNLEPEATPNLAEVLTGSAVKFLEVLHVVGKGDRLDFGEERGSVLQQLGQALLENKCPLLKDLDVSGNRGGEEALRSLLDGAKLATKLTTLSIGDNKAAEFCVKKLAECVDSWPELKHLRLREIAADRYAPCTWDKSNEPYKNTWEQFARIGSNEGLEALKNLLSKCQQIVTLDLANLRIEGGAPAAEILGLQSLKKLSLAKTTTSIKTFAEELKKQPLEVRIFGHYACACSFD